MFDLNFFMALGLLGQGMFSMRFIVQWIASEKAGKSVIPFSFWLFSFGGSLLLFIYAVYKKDPVFILGQAPNIFIYSRNIWLIRKEKIKEEKL